MPDRSTGRTLDFDSDNEGSSPSPAVKESACDFWGIYCILYLVGG